MAFRNTIRDFMLANPLYVGARVTFYTVDDSGAATATLATLYAEPLGTATLANPQTLDGDGKFSAPVYIDSPVIAEVVSSTVGTHRTGIIATRGIWRGNWVAATTYFTEDLIRDPSTQNVYVAADDFTSASLVASDISAGHLVLVVDVAALELVQPDGWQVYTMASQGFVQDGTITDNMPFLTAWYAKVAAGTVQRGSILLAEPNNGEGYGLMTEGVQVATGTIIAGRAYTSPAFFRQRYTKGNVLSVTNTAASTKGKTVSIAGTLVNGHTLSLAFDTPAVTVSHVVNTATDSRGSIVDDLISQINADVDLDTAGIKAIVKWDDDDVFGIYWPASASPTITKTDPDSNITLSSPIRITTATNAITTGQVIGVRGVGGTTEANSIWNTAVYDTTTVDLIGSVYANPFTSAGHLNDNPLAPLFKLGPTQAGDFYADDQLFQHVNVQVDDGFEGGIVVDLGSYDLTNGGPTQATWPMGVVNGHYGAVYNSKLDDLFVHAGGTGRYWIGVRVDAGPSWGNNSDIFKGARNIKLNNSTVYASLAYYRGLFVRSTQAFVMVDTQIIGGGGETYDTTICGKWNNPANGALISARQLGGVEVGNYSVGAIMTVGNIQGAFFRQSSTGNVVECAYASQLPVMAGQFNRCIGPYFDYKSGSDGVFLNNVPNWDLTGNLNVTGLSAVQATSQVALTVSRYSGGANPTFSVNTLGADTGVQVFGAASGSGAGITPTSPGTNESIYFAAKGTGNPVLGNSTNGNVIVGSAGLQIGSDLLTTRYFQISGLAAQGQFFNAGSGHASSFLSYSNSILSANLALDDGATRSGSNAGSNIGLFTYDDAAALIRQNLKIDRDTGRWTITVGASTTAWRFGPNGGTNPAETIDTSAASAATGRSYTMKAAGSGSYSAVTSSASNEDRYDDAKGTGKVHIGTVSSGGVELGGAVSTLGKLTTAASASGGAGLVVPHGSAPSAPTDGALWTTTAGIFARINGVTEQYAKLASPTFTGTLNAADISATGALTVKSGTAPGDAASATECIVMTSSGIKIIVGTSSPNGAKSAGQGSIYSRTNGSTTTSRMYVNTDGGTTWTPFVTSA